MLFLSRSSHSWGEWWCVKVISKRSTWHTMELSNGQTCLKVEGLIFYLCRFLKNMITFFNNKCLMYVLRLILKSDGKSWAAYKVFKYNFYIGSVKKKSLFSKKKRKGTSYPPIWPRYFVTCLQTRNPIQAVYIWNEVFLLGGYNKSPVLKVNYQKNVTHTTNSAIFSLFCTK